MIMYRPKTIIKIKHGCKECEAGNNKPIYALGLCQYHYQIHSLKKRTEKYKTEEQKDESKELWMWYERRIGEQEGRCEECGSRIIHKEKKFEHWSCCHVLPKNHFDSVKTHDDNCIELCWQCHTTFDDYMQERDERLFEMRIFSNIYNIIIELSPFVKERRRLNSLMDFFETAVIKKLF